MIKSKMTVAINTIKASFIELLIEPLVASYITHLYTFGYDSLDVTFGIKATCIM